MKTIAVKGYIHAESQEWNDKNPFRFGFATVELKELGYLTVMPYTLTFEMPDDWNPQKAQIECLLEKKKQVEADFAKTVRRIDDQLSRLQAIEYTVAA